MPTRAIALEDLILDFGCPADLASLSAAVAADLIGSAHRFVFTAIDLAIGRGAPLCPLPREEAQPAARRVEQALCEHRPKSLPGEAQARTHEIVTGPE